MDTTKGDALLKVAVVGLGMGRHHAHAFQEAERADLRWVVDLNESLAQKIADEVNCGWTTSLEEVIDDVDAVSLCLPHHLHASVAVMAMNKGKHVLVEKPMANTEAECMQMMQAAEDNDVKLMVAFPLRFRPEYVALKEAIDSGEYGQVISANGFVHTRLEPMPDSWFAKKEQLGGGVLISHACHDLDILIWLFGDPVKAHYVGTRNGTQWMEGEGTAHVLLEFEKGIVGNLSVSWGMPFADQPARLQVHTSDTFFAVRGSRLVIKDEAGERSLYEVPKNQPRTVGAPVIDEVEHFLTCVLEDRQPFTDGQDALRSHRVIWDLYGEGRP